MSKIIDWFVNRTKQYEGFLKLVARATPKQIMLVEAPSEMGKTWLIQRLRHECSVQKLPVAHYDFSDRRAWDYLALVRQARDQMGAEHFNPLTRVINEATNVNLQVTQSGGGGGVELKVATEGGQVKESTVTVGDVAGRDIIKDNYFFIQADSPILRQAIEARITDTFIDNLKTLTLQQVAVFLFDSFEEVTNEAEEWLQASLFARVRDGLLPNVIIVIAGQRVPKFDDVWAGTVARTGLALFEREHVAEYIQRRGLLDLDLNTILRTSGGNPGLLARMADVAAVKKESDGDWL